MKRIWSDFVNAIYRWMFDHIIHQHDKWRWSKGEKGKQLSFQNYDISEADFKKTRMTNCEFHHANLTKSNFSFAEFRKSYFKGAEMSYCIFHDANLMRAELQYAQMRQVTHQIHIRNRQKEDVIRLYDDLDNMEQSVDKEIISRFLRKNDVQRPRLQ